MCWVIWGRDAGGSVFSVASGFYERSLGKRGSFAGKTALSPLGPVVLTRLPTITSSFTGHWGRHVTKTDNLQTFPRSIHSACWICSEWGALPLRSWTRKSVSWRLFLLPQRIPLPLAGENEMVTIRTERWMCKERSWQCQLLVCS